MAHARKIETGYTKGSSTEAKNVKKPENMLNHKNTKQFKDEGEKVTKAKEVKKEKMTRAQVIEQFKVDMAQVAESKPKLALKAQKYYESLFQVASVDDFMVMIQKVDVEAGVMELKSGFALPVLPKADVLEFMDFFVSITAGEKSPTYNIVNYYLDNPEYTTNIALFTYAMFELVGAGRKTPNIDWNEVEADSDFGFDVETDEGLYSKVYLLIQDYLESPDADGEAASKLKGALMALAPNAFEVFHPLFNRESFKKLGMTVSSPTEGKEAIITPVISEIIGYMMFDTFGDYAVVEDEDEEAEEEDSDEEEEVPAAKKQKTSPKDTQKPKVEVEEEEDSEEEEETPFDSDEEETEDEDDIEVDGDEWDEEEDEEEY